MELLLSYYFFLYEFFETIFSNKSFLPLNSKKSFNVVIFMVLPSLIIDAEPWLIQYSSNHSSPSWLKVPFPLFKSAISTIEPIFAVLPEPCLSLAIFHFSEAKKSKSFITEVIDFNFFTVVTSLSPTRLFGVSYSSWSSLSWIISE